MTSFSTNHSRPWMDMVEMLNMPEDEAKHVFDHIEPLLTMEERYQIIRKLIEGVKAHNLPINRRPIRG